MGEPITDAILPKFWRSARPRGISPETTRYRLMGVVEGWCVVRIVGMMPFLVSEREMRSGAEYVPEAGSPPMTAPRRPNGKAVRAKRSPTPTTEPREIAGVEGA